METQTTHAGPYARKLIGPHTAKKPKTGPIRKPKAPQALRQAIPANKERKLPVTHKDLMIAYLIDGVDAINPLLVEHSGAVAVLDRMIETLQAKGQDSEELETLRDFHAEATEATGPGRRPVRVGDTREYTVQQVGEDGDLFMRVPVGTLSVNRGEKVMAAFEDGRIRITT